MQISLSGTFLVATALGIGALLPLGAPWSGTPGIPAAAAQEGDAPRARFRKEMDAVYDYLPFDVTQEVRDAKVAKMDGFWKFVASDLATYLPILRETLRDEKTNLYFLFDGGALLVEHSKEPADLQLACDALVRCRMKDVGSGYFHYCHHLARLDADVIPAVMQMLDDPQFSVFIVQHALKMKQSDCVRLCALVAGEDRWVARFAKRARTEKDPIALATLLRCLADAVTPEATDAIRLLAEDPKLDPATVKAAATALTWTRAPEPLMRDAKATHAEFAAWLAQADKDGRLPTDRTTQAMLRDAPVLVDASDTPSLRSLRRKTARRISDEAIDEIRILTGLMRRAGAKPE